MSTEAVQRAFDELAPDYDEDFTGSRIGRLQRAAFWRLLGAPFGEGDHVLDLGCGTGEDAVRLARLGCSVDGIDVSPGMIEAARARAEAEGLAESLSFRALPIERVADLAPERYEGVISNFGPVNCVEDLAPVARTLGERVRPGGVVALCVMSRFCLWETLFYPLTLQLHKAFRRFSGEYAESRVGGDESFRVYYPSVRLIVETFAPEFAFERAPGIGVFLPPSYLEPFAQRFPGLVETLAGVDRVVGGWPVFRSVADHRLVLLRRRAA